MGKYLGIWGKIILTVLFVFIAYIVIRLSIHKEVDNLIWSTSIEESQRADVFVSDVTVTSISGLNIKEAWIEKSSHYEKSGLFYKRTVDSSCYLCFTMPDDEDFNTKDDFLEWNMKNKSTGNGFAVIHRKGKTVYTSPVTCEARSTVTYNVCYEDSLVGSIVFALN